MNTKVPTVPQWLTEAEVRARFDVSRSTMWRWRQNGTGPRCYMDWPAHMYHPVELMAWHAARA